MSRILLYKEYAGMLSRIRTLLPEGNRKFPLKYRRMLGVINDRLEFAKSRFLFGRPVKTPGLDLLKYFILNVNLVELDGYSSDVARYTEVIKFFKNGKSQIFDPAINGTIRGGRFVRSTGSTPPPEVILNVDPSNPLQVLPFDKPWEEWQHLRAVRMLYHDSLEIVDQFQTQMLDFKVDPPSFVVFSLDVSILLFKYYKYWKNCQTIGVECDPDEFIQKFEIASIFMDQFDIWLFNLLTIVFAEGTAASDIVKQLHVPTRIVMDNMLQQGVEGLQEFVALTKGGNVRPQDFLATRWFTNSTVEDRMRVLDTWCDLPERHQYLWARALIWLPYLNLLMLLVKIFPDGAISKLILERGDEIYIKKFKYVRMPAVTSGTVLTEFSQKLNKIIEAVLHGETITDEMLSSLSSNKNPSGEPE